MANGIRATIERAFPRVHDAWMNSPGDNGRQNLCTFLVLVERDFPDETLRIQVAMDAAPAIIPLRFDLAHRNRAPVVIYANSGPMRAASARPFCLR